MAGNIKHRLFGRTQSGQKVYRYTLTNSKGCFVQIIDYGANLTSMHVPDRMGNLGDVLLGHSTLEPYIENKPHLGSVCGRYANRIANATFEIDGVSYPLDKNHGNHHLHGGAYGFHRVLWATEEVGRHAAVALKFTYISPDGEQGYPGTLTVHVTYILTEGNTLRIEYVATTDKPTFVNLTNHAYFNFGQGDILGHELTIPASYYLETDSDLIPTGDLRSVAGTPLDFRRSMAIGMRITQHHPSLIRGNGYDACYIPDRQQPGLMLAAKAFHPQTGRLMSVYSTEPALQLYSAGNLAKMTGKRGRKYGPNMGFCLETQHYPDSPHHRHFPSTLLLPSDRFESVTEYRFATS